MLQDRALSFTDQTSTDAAWDITGNEYSPYTVDLGSARSRGGITGRSAIWIQVTTAADHGTGDEQYDFQLWVSDTKTGTEGTNVQLNGTVSKFGLTSELEGDDTKIDTAGKFAYVGIIPATAKGRYAQLYCLASHTSPSISVRAGITDIGAIPVAWNEVVMERPSQLPS